MRGKGTRPHDLRDKLRSLFGKTKLPTNPAIAMEILRLADDPNSSADQFASVIQTDGALAARLLQMANAAGFGQRAPATTIQRAVTVLGLRRIRMVSLGFQLVAHLDRLGGCSFDLKMYWQHSVLRACLARELAAKVVPTQADEAFVVGLLQDGGIRLLVQVLGTEYAKLCAAANLSPTAFYMKEKERFPYDHVEAIGVMAAEWNLPEVIAEPLVKHHEQVPLGPDSSELQRLSAVSYFVGSLPLVGGQVQALDEPELRSYAEGELALDEATLTACFQSAAAAYRNVAPMLAEHLPDELDVADLLDQANRHLSRAATEAEGRAEAVEAECDQIRWRQMHLKSALGQYREQAAHDPLTRLLNRGALVDATQASIRACRDKDVALAVFFLDLDDFKVINDSFGHHVGDEILRALAGVLSDSVVNGGFAGRYGGEEFILGVPALTEDEARGRTLALIDNVRHTMMPPPCRSRSLTCSVGVVWGRLKPETSAQHLFAQADELMYLAKLGGKDRGCFKSLESPNAVFVLEGDGESDEAVKPAGDHPTVSKNHPQVSREDLQRLAIALNRIEPTRFASMRKQERHSLLRSCVVNSFSSDSSILGSHPGYVRNVSTGGVGVVTTRPMTRGEPVEIAIQQGNDDRPSLYVGGIVAFCRHIEGGVYEVGIQLLAQGNAPILSSQSASAEWNLDWAVKALREVQDRDDRLKHSA